MGGLDGSYVFCFFISTQCRGVIVSIVGASFCIPLCGPSYASRFMFRTLGYHITTSVETGSV